MIREIYIWDIDGVLIDSSHRFKTLENGKVDLDYWNANKHLCEQDKLLPHSWIYADAIANPEVYNIIATARCFSELEMKVFKDLLPMPDHLISRSEKDERGSIAMKLSGLKKILSLQQFRGKRKYFFEDTESVLIAVCRSINAIPIHVKSSQGVWD